MEDNKRLNMITFLRLFCKNINSESEKGEKNNEYYVKVLANMLTYIVEYADNKEDESILSFIDDKLKLKLDPTESGCKEFLYCQHRTPRIKKDKSDNSSPKNRSRQTNNEKIRQKICASLLENNFEWTNTVIMQLKEYNNKLPLNQEQRDFIQDFRKDGFCETSKQDFNTFLASHYDEKSYDYYEAAWIFAFLCFPKEEDEKKTLINDKPEPVNRHDRSYVLKEVLKKQNSFYSIKDEIIPSDKDMLSIKNIISFPEPIVPLIVNGQDTIAEIYVSQEENSALKTYNEIITNESDNILILGEGGAGKSFTLQYTIANDESSVYFYIPLKLYHNKDMNMPNGIIKYIFWTILDDIESYRDEVPENDKPKLRQLRKAFKSQTGNSNRKEYTICLDGINELPVDMNDCFIKELKSVLSEWKNVRIILTSRQLSSDFANNTVFQKLIKYNVIGITDDDIREKYGISVENDNTPYSIYEVLRRPMFLSMYIALNGNTQNINTAGELLDRFYTEYEQNLIGIDARSVFMLQYALPAVATLNMDVHGLLKRFYNNYFDLKLKDCYNSINAVYKRLIKNDRVYDYYTSRKVTSQFESCAWAEEFIRITQRLSLGTINNQNSTFLFSHQIIHDFFCAKYILNTIELALNLFPDNSVKRYKYLNPICLNFNDSICYGFTKYWPISVCKLFSEIIGDYKNAPVNNTYLPHTVNYIDMLLDTVRGQDEDTLVINIVNTLSISRNNHIYDTDFSHIIFPLIGCDLYKKDFSYDGTHPCDFSYSTLDITNFALCYTSIGISSDGKRIAFGSNHNYISIVDTTTKELISRFQVSESCIESPSISSISFFNDNKFLLITNGFQISIWSIEDSYCQVFKTYSKPYEICFDRWFIHVLSDQVMIYDPITDTEERLFTANEVSIIAASEKNTCFVTYTRDNHIIVYNLYERRIVITIPYEEHIVRIQIISDNSFRIWNECTNSLIVLDGKEVYHITDSKDNEGRILIDDYKLSLPSSINYFYSWLAEETKELDFFSSLINIPFDYCISNSQRVYLNNGYYISFNQEDGFNIIREVILTPDTRFLGAIGTYNNNQGIHIFRIINNNQIELCSSFKSEIYDSGNLVYSCWDNTNQSFCFHIAPLQLSLIRYDILTDKWSEIDFNDVSFSTNMKNCNCQNLINTSPETIEWLKEHGAKT